MMVFLNSLKAVLVSALELVNKQIQIEKGEEPSEDKLPSRNEKVLHIARREIGVKEVRGSGNNAQVVEYHKYASKDNTKGQPDSVPWCSSFVCYVVEKSGMGSTNSMMARSWMRWGVSSKDKPLPGDIVVYWRESIQGWKGHVGIYLKTNADGSIVTLGGNQSDEVNVTTYSGSKLLDIRRSSKAREYDVEDEAILYVLARGIIDGKVIAMNGKVD